MFIHVVATYQLLYDKSLASCKHLKILLNNINNKENNSKPEKGHSDKTIYINIRPASVHHKRITCCL